MNETLCLVTQERNSCLKFCFLFGPHCHHDDRTGNKTAEPRTTSPRPETSEVAAEGRGKITIVISELLQVLDGGEPAPHLIQ